MRATLAFNGLGICEVLKIIFPLIYYVSKLFWDTGDEEINMSSKYMFKVNYRLTHLLTKIFIIYKPVNCRANQLVGFYVMGV